MNRKFRLLTGLGVAMLLCVAMVYTALANGSVQRPIVEVADLQHASATKTARTKTVELVGIAAGPIHGKLGQHVTFMATDPSGKHHVKVDYSGSVPDAFRVGRTIVVSGKLHGSTFHAMRDSLVTKCPSKFQGSSSSKQQAAA